jgi:hypothetical protein
MGLCALLQVAGDSTNQILCIGKIMLITSYVQMPRCRAFQGKRHDPLIFCRYSADGGASILYNYSALTLVPPGRATVKRRSPTSHPGRPTPTDLNTTHKPHAGELGVGWVTTSESSLLYVFFFSLSFLLFILWGFFASIFVVVYELVRVSWCRFQMLGACLPDLG